MSSKERPKVIVDETGICFNLASVSKYGICHGQRFVVQIDEPSRTVRFKLVESGVLTYPVTRDFKLTAFRRDKIIRRGGYPLRQDGDYLFFRWQAKRPPRPRCAICGKRFYDYRLKGDRLCRRKECRDKAKALEARVAHKRSKSPAHLTHQSPNVVKIAGSFAFGDGDDPRQQRPMSYITRSVSWRRGRRPKDPEIEALKKAEAFRKWREENPERAREVQRESFKRHAEKKLAEDPDWRRKRYERYVKNNPEQMEKARQRARERYRRLKEERKKKDD